LYGDRPVTVTGWGDRSFAKLHLRLAIDFLATLSEFDDLTGCQFN
jgi:hypothetical protein